MGYTAGGGVISVLSNIFYLHEQCTFHREMPAQEKKAGCQLGRVEIPAEFTIIPVIVEGVASLSHSIHIFFLE